MFGLLKKQHSFLAVDIGSSSLKFLELSTSGEKPTLLKLDMKQLSGEVFSNNMITNASRVAEAVNAFVEENDCTGKRVVTAVPGPAVFTKRIKMAHMDLADLEASIQMEAANFIPHNISAVKLDFHILGEAGKNQLDVLIVAVKNEIIDSFSDAMSLAGLDLGIVDVDYFALQNAFEANYPEMTTKNVAIINMGYRYSSINICKNGQTLFTGDISTGSKHFTDTLVEIFGVTPEEANKLKRGESSDSKLKEAASDILQKSVEQVAADFNRQLTFFWNASGSDEGIDAIFLTGGGSLTPGFVEALGEKTTVECKKLDPFKEVEIDPSIGEDRAKSLAPYMGVAFGLGLREYGDKIIPDSM